MKKNLILITSLIAVAFISCKKSSQSNDLNLSNGLLAYYPFNGNVNDSGPNKLNGVIHGSVGFIQDMAGKPNSAVTFDGSTGYILVTDNLGVLNTDAVSVSFFVYTSNTATRGALINKVNFSDATGFSYGINISSPTINSEFNFGAIPANFSCSSVNYDVSNILEDNGYIIMPNQWYHIVAVFANSVQKIYVNGVLSSYVKRNYQTLNKCSNNPDLVIGGWWQNDIISLNGSMDELRIYNRELNQDEINALAKLTQ